MKPQTCDLPYQYMSQLCHYDEDIGDTVASVRSGDDKKTSSIYDNYGYYEGDGYLVEFGKNRSAILLTLLRSFVSHFRLLWQKLHSICFEYIRFVRQL